LNNYLITGNNDQRSQIGIGDEAQIRFLLKVFPLLVMR
jgi:hypothetical protein